MELRYLVAFSPQFYQEQCQTFSENLPQRGIAWLNFDKVSEYKQLQTLKVSNQVNYGIFFSSCFAEKVNIIFSKYLTPYNNNELENAACKIQAATFKSIESLKGKIFTFIYNQKQEIISVQSENCLHLKTLIKFIFTEEKSNINLIDAADIDSIDLDCKEVGSLNLFANNSLEDFKQTPLFKAANCFYNYYLTQKKISNNTVIQSTKNTNTAGSNELLSIYEFFLEQPITRPLEGTDFNFTLLADSKLNELFSKITNVEYWQENFLSLYFYTIGGNYRYSQQRAVQHASQALAYSLINSWREIPLQFTQNKIKQLLISNGSKQYIDNTSLQLTLKSFELKNLHSEELLTNFNNIKQDKSLKNNSLHSEELKLNQVFNTNYFTQKVVDTDVLALQNNSKKQKSAFNNVDTITQNFNLQEQSIVLTLTGSYLGYTAKLTRTLALIPQISIEKRTNANHADGRKRGANSINNYDHYLQQQLKLSNYNKYLANQPIIERELVEATALLNKISQGLRPNITVLYALVCGLFSTNLPSLQKIKEDYPQIDKIFPTFFLQKNNKHLAKLNTQLTLETNDKTWQIYALCLAIFTGNNPEIPNTKYQILASKLLPFAGVLASRNLSSTSNEFSLNIDNYIITIQTLDHNLNLKENSILYQGMPLYLELVTPSGYKLGNTYLIEDNLVLRKNLTPDAPFTLQEWNRLLITV